MMIDFASKFASAREYAAFLEQYGSEEQRHRWEGVERQIKLTQAQRNVLATFVREMNLLCLAGAWCGDCAAQCPILQQFARICPTIHLRLIDRDADAALAAELRICGGGRVPVVLFLSEDFTECARYGDRTISRYRELARELHGAACPTGWLLSSDTLSAITDDWLRELERVQLMLRLSPRLRQLHGD